MDEKETLDAQFIAPQGKWRIKKRRGTGRWKFFGKPEGYVSEIACLVAIASLVLNYPEHYKIMET